MKAKVLLFGLFLLFGQAHAETVVRQYAGFGISQYLEGWGHGAVDVNVPEKYDVKRPFSLHYAITLDKYLESGQSWGVGLDVNLVKFGIVHSDNTLDLSLLRYGTKWFGDNEIVFTLGTSAFFEQIYSFGTSGGFEIALPESWFSMPLRLKGQLAFTDYELRSQIESKRGGYTAHLSLLFPVF